MNLSKFLTLAEGNWFSIRTDYFLATDQNVNGKAHLTMEQVPLTEARAQTLLAQFDHSSPKESAIAIVTGWDNSPDWDKPKQTGDNLVIYVPQGELEGIVMSNQSQEVGHYVFGEDEALTLNLSNDRFDLEERQWYASENLRLRILVAREKDSNHITQVSFYSDIRRVTVPPKETDS
jgi:hypothetical protein